MVRFLTSLLTVGLRIDGLMTWVLAPFVVWAFVLVAAILLPMVLFRKILQESRQQGGRPGASTFV